MCLALPCCLVLACEEQAPPFWRLVSVDASVQERRIVLDVFFRCTLVLLVLMRGMVWCGGHDIRQTAT